jgi:thiamine-phosphate pyrophosphorylase
LLLYYITDRSQFPGNEADRRSRLLATIAAAAIAGVDFVQLREKDLPIRALEQLAGQAVTAVSGTKAKLLINSRIDVAIAAGAHGIHLPSGNGELSASEARVLFHLAGVTAAVIGASCHSLEEVVAAESHGADFAVFGPVFEKIGVSVAGGLSELERVCARPSAPSSRMPVLALGGVTLENAQACIDHRADGIAAIRLFQRSAPEMEKAVVSLRKLQPSTRGTAEPSRHPYQNP